MKVSDRLRVLMALNGETKTILSQKSGISMSTLRRIDDTDTARLDVLAVLADYYGVTVEWLYKGSLRLEGFGVNKRY